MSENNGGSSIEVVFGPNEVRIEGSEKFVSEELETVLEKVDLTQTVEPMEMQTQTAISGGDKDTPREQASLDDESIGLEGSSNTDATNHSPLDRVADSLNVPAASLTNQFYLDQPEDEEEGDPEIHIMYPTQIPQKYALLGYCTIKEELTGQTYFDNKATKDKLVDGEKVPIEYWGRKLVHNLRNGGLIKDDPNSDKSRNRPFKVTPKGRSEFVQWVRQQS